MSVSHKRQLRPLDCIDVLSRSVAVREQFFLQPLCLVFAWVALNEDHEYRRRSVRRLSGETEVWFQICKSSCSRRQLDSGSRLKNLDITRPSTTSNIRIVVTQKQCMSRDGSPASFKWLTCRSWPLVKLKT